MCDFCFFHGWHRWMAPLPGYDRTGRKVSIYARVHSDPKDMIHTFRHEGRHFLDDINGLDRTEMYFEYRGQVEEFISRVGRTPTRPEMGTLARDMLPLYDMNFDERFRRILGY